MVDTRTNPGKAAFTAALAVVVLGLAVLTGWIFNSEILKCVVPGLTAMSPASAVAFILAGVSLALSLQSPHGRNYKWHALIFPARLCALLVVLIGLAKLVALLGGPNLGVDRWLFSSKLSDGQTSPNRIAPNAALNFLFLGGALLFVDAKNRFARTASELSILVVCLGAFLAVLGYAYDVQSFYRLGAFTPMALHTALAFSVLGGAFFLSHTDGGILAIFAGDNAGGAMARRLLPAVVLIPAGFGWLELHGEMAGFYDNEFGNALFAMGYVVVFTLLVTWSAWALFQADLAGKKIGEALRRQQSELRVLFDLVPAMIWFKDTNNGIVRVNKRVAEAAGKSIEEIEGKPAVEIYPHDAARYYLHDLEVIRSGRPKLGIIETIQDREGRELRVQTDKVPYCDQDGKVIGIVVMAQDVTERKQLEARLLQSQKMETVGKLAGGIAHEFNTILTTILVQCEFLLADLPAGSPPAKSAADISRAADRAANLTRQLLAYGSNQLLQPEILDLNSVLAGMEGALRHLLRRDTDLRIVPAAGLKAVKADVGQIEQVILNMALNAREAMPDGGQFTLETANVSFGGDSAGRDPELKPGDYVMLALTDTGTGMSAEAKARIFEPFFSTKGVGQGTGLGLSTCYGIIKQSGGHIAVESEPALGTTLKIYLPQVGLEAKRPLQRLASPGLPRGTETILLVEAELALREMAATLLERLGYTVWTAVNGSNALSLLQQRDIEHLDLLLTDVLMPQMGGKELSAHVLALHPRARMLFTSTYTETAIVQQGLLAQGVAVLQKPFTPSALAHKLREELDRLPSRLEVSGAAPA